MRFHFNSPLLKDRRKRLRKDSTEVEKILWNKIRGEKLGVKFFRQYSLDGYVMDFYCPEKRLAVEIDGGYHIQASSKVYDKYRERYISAFNIKIARFKNDEIINNRKFVIERINALLLG